MQSIRRMSVVALASIAGVTGVTHSVAAGIVAWDGGAGTESWNDAANWSTDAVPGPGDDVVIDVVGDITVRHESGAHEVASLICEESFVMQSGTLSSVGDMVFGGSIEYTGGRIEGPGTLIANGGMTIAGTTKDLWCNVTNNGVCTWTAGTIRMNGNTFLNSAGALFDVQGDLILTVFAVVGTVENEGEYRRSVGAGQHTIHADVVNASLFDLQTGNTRFQRSMVNSGVVTGGTLEIAGTTFDVPASGTVDVVEAFQSSGTTTIDGTYLVDVFTHQGGTTNLNPGAVVDLGTDYVHAHGVMNDNLGGTTVYDSVSLTAGTYSGSSDLTVNGLFTMNGGRIEGPGVLNANGGMSLGGTTKDLWRDAVNNGTCTWTSGVIRMNGNTITNPPGALFDVQADISLTVFSIIGTFVNNGEYRRSAGDGQHSINANFENNDLVDIQAGELRIQRVFNNPGAIIGLDFNVSGTTLNVPVGGAIDVDSMTQHAGTTTIDGTLMASNYSHNGGTTNLNPGAVIDIGSSYVHFNGAMNHNLGGTVNYDNFTLASGTFQGTTDIVVSSLFTCSGGRLDGPGNLTVNGSAAFDGTTKDLWRDLTFNGVCDWTSGTIRMNGNTFNNGTTGEFNVVGDLALTVFSAIGSFVNEGTYTRMSGDANHDLNVLFHNSGNVALMTGTTRQQQDYEQTAGSTNIVGTFFRQPSRDLFLLGGRLEGTGTLDGDLEQPTATVAPGHSPGTLTVNGDYVCATDGVLEIEVAGLVPNVDHDVIAVTETVTLDGQLDVSFTDGFDPQAGDQFTILTAASIVGNFGCADLPVLPGRRVQLSNTGTELILVVFGGGECNADTNADGVVDINDLLAMLAAWGPVETCEDQIADVNHDGIVAVDDLLILLGAWGSC